MRRVFGIAAISMLAVTSVGCESTQDKAKRVQAENAKKLKLASMPLTIPKADSRIKVLDTVVLRGKDVNAVVVTVKNTSAKPLADIPIAVDVLDSGGKEIDTNTNPGADHWLNHIPLVRPGQTVNWIQDQFDPKPAARRAKVKVGVGKVIARPYADAKLVKTHFFEDPISGTSYSGKATSAAPVLQERLVIYSVGRQGGRIVTAGRGVVERLKPNGGNKAGFTIFYTGKNPKTTTLSNLAPPVVSPSK